MRKIQKHAYAVTAAACLAIVVVGPAPASAAPVAPPAVAVLPLTRAADVVATADRVFVSGGRETTQIAVTDTAGAVTAVLDGLPGPGDLQLSDDRRTLYVALPGADAIAVFDTRTLRETARYSTGAGTCPWYVTVTGRYLWFGYGCGQWDSDIGRVDLRRRPAAAVTTGLAGQKFFVPPLLAAARDNPSILLVGETDPSPSRLWTYGIGARGTLTLTSPPVFDFTNENLVDIALEPTGEFAYTVAMSPGAVRAYWTPDLSQQIHAYHLGSFPAGLELNRAGTRIAATVQSFDSRQLHVFGTDGLVVAQVNLNGQTTTLARGGVAWSPNSRRVYAVTYDDTEPADRAELHILTVPAA
ncbi:hypothetical protein AB0M02_32925 [Actinoplanes sp. NPDC051861]|uniref:YncE family protein n=1 Tax=Actinoplanes sp. NPDC051861 TaxID=3155170 RepID=UPI00342097F2